MTNRTNMFTGMQPVSKDETFQKSKAFSQKVKNITLFEYIYLNISISIILFECAHRKHAYL